MSIKSPPSSDGYDTRDAEFAKDAADVTTSSRTGSLRLGESDGGVFATGGNIDSYKPIEKYEGAHRYDPTFHWTEGEEKKLIRRVCTVHHLLHAKLRAGDNFSGRVDENGKC